MAGEDSGRLFGFVKGPHGKPIEDAQVLMDEQQWILTDKEGYFHFEYIAQGQHHIHIYAMGYEVLDTLVEIPLNAPLQLALMPMPEVLAEVQLETQRSGLNGYTRLRAIEGTQIYSGKKNEVVLMEEIKANKATNNSRELYAKVAGVNIWESDAGGLQLGIGSRGLSPNRTSNFNVRQNGYDIAADALGYPESYYTPPAEAVQRIEVTRGAASLQYGTQFGGLLNFILKEGSRKKKLAIESAQTTGAFGLFSSYNALGGTLGKWNYYTFYQYKRGNSWRPNSGFEAHTVYAGLKFSPSSRWNLKAEYTHMSYLAQQPGGLTDAQFAQNPGASFRDRNFFRVNWNLMAIHGNFEIDEKQRINLRVFALEASRAALGYLGRIDRQDPGGYRDLIYGQFSNQGLEARYLTRYKWLGKQAVFTGGYRMYRGNTLGQQGFASASSDADFQFLNPDNLEYSDYVFPSFNQAFFVENLLRFNTKWSITPGFRMEQIQTGAEGWYQVAFTDLAGDTIYSNRPEESKSLNRWVPLAAVGLSYKPKVNHEWYANWAQNYRAVNFNDLRVVNPQFRVDSNLQDEKGFTLDLGRRGRFANFFSYDLSLFMLAYQQRIGAVQMADPNTFTSYRFRTNIADSRSTGLEWFIEWDFWSHLFQDHKAADLSVFVSGSMVQAKYLNSEEKLFEDKKVELVPALTLRAGTQWQRGPWSAKLQWSYTGSQFSDAANTVQGDPSAIVGEIPAYQVWDLSTGFEHKQWDFSAGVNNLLDARYFTRRATGYPGPGIIPAEARNWYFGLRFNW